MDSFFGAAARLTPSEVAALQAMRLAQSALPVLIPSSGSVGANGALTLTTAIPLSGGYSWGCYMHFPANAVFSGSAAGFYYVVMSSNAAGTIYNNTYTSGSPTVPTSPTAISAAGPGAYTQSTSQINMATVTVGANVIGANGRLQAEAVFVFPSNANSKTTAIYLGASVLFGKTRTTTTQETPLVDIRNRGAVNRQLSGWATTGGPATSSSSGVVNTAIDTSAAVDVTFRGQLSVATDYIILEGFSLLAYPFP